METNEYYLNQIKQAREKLERNAQEVQNLANEAYALKDVISEAEWHLCQSDDNLCVKCDRLAECQKLSTGPWYALECAYYNEKVGEPA